MDNPEKLTTFGTQDRGRRQTTLMGNEESKIQRNWQHLLHKTLEEDKQTEGQSRMDNPDKVATFGAQDTGRRQTKLRGNHEWTIQRNWQHLVPLICIFGWNIYP